ncbi:MAG: helix-turn-helix domain-containing protein [Dysgonamonadaceae bacterium]|jgi:signal transduction histidine kinase/ligand-binding sensor domain-containing protein/AraC-like DNA-binding protein|nr:helix-turn-helix domain-containing protein [Dysgonamonadaceae bacterium]
MLQKRYIYLVCSFFLSLPLPAERIQLWTPNEGLSNSHITQIYQDSYGYIWIATENGLNKFNGYTFTVYSEQVNDSLALRGNYVYTVLEDSRGIFWVGTMSGLFQYDRTKDSFLPFLIQDTTPFYLDRVIWILEDKKGNIWLSYPGNGVICLNAHTMKPTFYNKANSSITENGISCAYEDSEGNLWLGTEDAGVFRFNPSTGEFRHFRHNPALPGSLNNDKVFSICEDSAGRILIGTLGGGINIYNRITGTFQKMPGARTPVENHIYALYSDKKGQIWAGADGAGILCYDVSGKQLPVPETPLETTDLKQAKVHYIYEDKEGNMWFALYQKGILFLPSIGESFRNYGFNPFDTSQSIGTHCVISVLEDSRNNIWIGTDGDGLYKINHTTREIEHYTAQKTPEGPGNVITALFEDKDHNIWVGTYVNGMFRYNSRTRRFDTHYRSEDSPQTIAHNHVVTFAQGKDGTLWIGTNGGGINRLDIEKKVFKHYSYRDNDSSGNQLSSNWVYTLFIDEDETIWIGTSNGINCLNPQTETFSNYSLTNKLLNTNLIYTINRDYKGNIWIGGFFGLYCIDRQTGEIVRKTTLDGLPDNMINGIEEDKDHFLWLSTGKGLCRYNPETGSCLNFYATDGIQSNEFRRGSHYKGKNDRMYFGGINGLTTFVPSKLIHKNSLLRLAFTGLLVYNAPIQAGRSSITETVPDEMESIRLKYNQRSFTFTFAALEYGMPQRVMYYTQMENFDKQWRKVNDPGRSVTYTNLNPGKYIFKVKATLDDENFLEREMQVIIEPPFWLTVWAKVFYAFLLLLLAYAVYSYINYRMRQRRMLIEKEQQKQLSESKLQFFTDISHEIRTPLTLIVGPIEKLIGESDPSDKKKISTYNIIYRNALRILRLINQLMDLRAIDKGKLKLKVEPSSVQEFVEKIMDSFKDLATSKKMDFNLVVENDIPPVYIDKDCLDKIIFNLLSNAFKFTPQGGKITVFIRTVCSELEIQVEDTGIGISKEKRALIFDRFYQIRDSKIAPALGAGIGLHLSKMMVELHHGRIDVESEPGMGSRFIIRLPLDKKAYSPEEFGTYSGETTATMLQPSFPLPIDDSYEKEETKKRSYPTTKSLHTLLLVEDDVSILRYIESEFAGKYRIYTANNGKDALTQALKYLPDVVVSDVVMPEMDGLTLCKLLKSNDKTCHIPVILLTAKTNPEHQIEGLEMGADSYIPKPFNLKHLETQVHKLIQLRDILKDKYSGSMEAQREDIQVVSSDEKLFRKFNDKLKEHIADPNLSVESISRELGLSRVHLNRRLKAITKESPGNYIRNFRLKQAAWLLLNKNMSIAEVAYAVGFSSHAYFSNIFREHFGMSPSEYVDVNK